MQNFIKVVKVSLLITVFVAILSIFIFGDGDYSFDSITRNIIISLIFSFGLTAVNSYYYDGTPLTI